MTVTVNDSFREKCSAQTLWVDYKKMIQVLSVGNLIYVDDGLISLKVTEKGSDYLKCIVVNGGKLGSKKVMTHFIHNIMASVFHCFDKYFM